MSIENKIVTLFGVPQAAHVFKIDDDVSVLGFDLNSSKRVHLFITSGLSSHEMNVPDHLKSENRCEIYFCLPSYWEPFNDLNPNTSWVKIWLELIVKYIKSNNNWIGLGHTLKCGADKLPLSPILKQEYFVFSDPVLLADEFEELKKLAGVNIFAVIPLFKKEFEYKQRKGIEKLKLKMKAAGMTEKLDEFRPSLIRRSRLLF